MELNIILQTGNFPSLKQEHLDTVDITPAKINIIVSGKHLTYNDIRYFIRDHEVYMRGQVDMVTLYVTPALSLE